MEENMKIIILVCLFLSSIYLASEDIDFSDLYNFSWSTHYKGLYGKPSNEFKIVFTFDKDKEIVTAIETINNEVFTTDYNFYQDNKRQIWIYYKNPELPIYIIEKIIGGWGIFIPDTDEVGLKVLAKVPVNLNNQKEALKEKTEPDMNH